jgi:hypothetical protein
MPLKLDFNVSGKSNCLDGVVSDEPTIFYSNGKRGLNKHSGRFALHRGA